MSSKIKELFSFDVGWEFISFVVLSGLWNEKSKYTKRLEKDEDKRAADTNAFNYIYNKKTLVNYTFSFSCGLSTK